MCAYLRNASIVIIACDIFAGCATVPDVTAHYYFPRALTQLQLTETLVCNKAHTAVLTTASVVPTTSYLADVNLQTPTPGDNSIGVVSYRSVNGPFTDMDLTFNFTDDGRLSGINAVSTGQGDTVIKDVVSIAGTFGVLDYAADYVVNRPAAPTRDELCTEIANYMGAEAKPISLLYSASIDFQANPNDPDDLTMDYELVPSQTNSPLYGIVDSYRNNLPYRARVTTGKAAQAAATYGSRNCPIQGPYLELNRHTIATVAVYSPGEGPASGQDLRSSVWANEIPVPLKAKHYCLPIPAGEIFGGATLSLQLSGYGSIQKLDYGKKTGAQDALDSTNALATALKGPSAATLAAKTKAQADEIAQQQRLMGCQLDPANCKP